MGKPRGLPAPQAGFPPSRVGFPASRRCACASFRPSRSDHLSTGRSCESHSQNVLCRIDIAVMRYTTFGACPVTNIKRQGVENMTTIETTLRGRIPLVNLDERSPIPLSFVFELSHKLAPSHIGDGLRQCVVLYHVLFAPLARKQDVQTLNAYDLVLTYNLCRELVLIVTPPISNLG